MSISSQYYTSIYKQNIVEYYIQHHSGESFSSVAKRFSIKGGHVTVARWYHDYDGTIESLEPKFRSGRPHILNNNEISQNITNVIRSSNRAGRGIHYTNLVEPIQQKTSKQVSLRTIQRYGQEKGIKSKRTTKRKASECKHTHIHT
jgi:transposase